MSGFFGIFNRNGKNVTHETVDVLLDAMSYRDPDEADVRISGSVALGHGMLRNTPESGYEHLPLYDGTYVLTMDARIDNREELAEEIELPTDRPLCEIGDSEFVLGAYRKWGEACPEHLLGDFAFAIRDEKRKRVFCARDQVGVKQFYYHLSDDLFLFGNDLKVLTAYPDISQTVNDEAVANYIVHHQLTSKTLTFFEAFRKLPPAHTLVVSDTVARKKCYWKPEHSPGIKLPDAEAYAGKLRELLEEAVYCRLRSDYPVASHLSGGLDSSSIAVLAARKLKEKNEKLLVFNWVPAPKEEDDPEYYEWANSKNIADAEGMEHRYVTLASENVAGYMRKRGLVYGDTATFWYEYPVREAAQAKGSRTLLSGFGGDEFATQHGHGFYSGLFLHGKWLKLFDELKLVKKRKKGFRPFLAFVYHHLFMPFVPEKLYCKAPRTQCRNPDFDFLQKKYRELAEKEYGKPRGLTVQAKKTVREHMLAHWRHGHLQSRMETWAAGSAADKLEYSYPLLDRRIIEYVFGIPEEYFVHDMTGRYLFRTAVKDLLPDRIIWGSSKIESNRVKSMNETVSTALEILRNEEKHVSGYIDAEKAARRVRDLKAASNNQNDYAEKLRIVALSSYLKNTERLNSE